MELLTESAINYPDFPYAVEIFFEQQLLFHYSQIEEMKHIYPNTKDCNIYFLLGRDKLQFVSYELNSANKTIHIKYLNEYTKQFSYLEFKSFFDFAIPFDLFSITFEGENTILKIELTKSGQEWLLAQPQKQSWKTENPIYLTVYDLVSLYNYETGQSNAHTYPIYYIGQSLRQENEENSYNIFDRLISHEKVAAIFRDYNTKHRYKELMVLIMQSSFKAYKSCEQKLNYENFMSSAFEMLRSGGGVFMADPLQSNALITTKSDEVVGSTILFKDIVNIVEAILINYFKPPYNKDYVDTPPSLKQKAYAVFYDAKIRG